VLGEFLPLAVVIFGKQLLLVVTDVPLGNPKVQVQSCLPYLPLMNDRGAG